MLTVSSDFKCFEQCYIKANFQIMSSLLEVSCTPWYQTKISLQIISKEFPLSFKTIHLIKRQKLTKDIGCFVSLKFWKAINSFWFMWSGSTTDLFSFARLFWQKCKSLFGLRGQVQPLTYFSLQDYSDKSYKSFLIFVVRLFFSFVGKFPPAAKMPWGYLSGKKIIYKIKSLCAIYIQHHQIAAW